MPCEAPRLIIFGLLLVLTSILLVLFVCNRTPVASSSPSFGAANACPLLRVHSSPVLSPETCQSLLERYVPSITWETARHQHYPTTDIALYMLPALEQEILPVTNRILDLASEFYGIARAQLWLRDQFLVKYSMDAQRELETHRDASTVSYIIALNDSFEDGGFKFADESDVRKPPVGHVLLFCGKRLHSGQPISAGVRYIITGFIDVHEDLRQTMPQCTSLRPLLAPSVELTRPYLLANVERLLGPEGASRGDFTALCAESSRFDVNHSLKEAACQVVRSQGRTPGLRRAQEAFHDCLTQKALCHSTFCYPTS